MKFGLNKYFILAIITLKVILIYLLNSELNLVPDEQDAYNIAENIVNLGKQVIHNDFSNSLQLTARRGAGNIFLYSFLITNQIKISAFVLGYYILYIFLFVWSVSSFNKILKFYEIDDKLIKIAVLVYCLYPSSLYYIGTKPFWENFAVCVLVIFFQLFITNSQKWYINSIVALLALFSMILRPHCMPIFVFLSIVFVYRKYLTKANMIILIIMLFFYSIINCLLIVRNQKYTGYKTSTTQIGFELLQGHNPDARGSWRFYNYQTDTNNVIHKFFKSKIPNSNFNNEFEQSKLRQNVAIQWAINNPIKEIEITLRKVAIFFLPQNFELDQSSSWWNPINLVIHIGFIFYLFLMMIYREKRTFNHYLLIVPFICSIAISIIFFTGYRWRFYCEPFMIISAFVFVNKYKRILFQLRAV
ncbi:MAG: hypothetical protein U0V72_02245 [Cytophagales bacterium]